MFLHDYHQWVYTESRQIPNTRRQEAPLLRPQVETIDLTADDSPVKPEKAPSVSRKQFSPPHKLELDDTLVDPPQSDVSTPFRKSRSTPAAGSTAKSARCVTFAPDVEERPSSPTPLARAPFATTDVSAEQIQGAKQQERPRTGTVICVALKSDAH